MIIKVVPWVPETSTKLTVDVMRCKHVTCDASFRINGELFVHPNVHDRLKRAMIIDGESWLKVIAI